LDLSDALAVLDDLLGFCRSRGVVPQVCLSGGDPLFYPFFWELYEAVAKARVAVSLLGNPIAPEVIRRLQVIQAPVYYQVSLEGLAEHNDAVRGAGHFERTMSFLRHARRLGLETHVMLTLTRDNLEQVIPLGDVLRGWTARFTFNRLSQTGEAEGLALPEPQVFASFLERYLAARRTNPVFGVKDNLFNILRDRSGRRPFPGCTHFGCGAAFNFVALLPDGELHACRKYPSRIGNIREACLARLYDSPVARRYRAGAVECQRCKLRRSCGGCPAVTFGQGLDPLLARDPFCFVSGTRERS
jgi:selenobiotic family peptide radical SAM maturase